MSNENLQKILEHGKEALKFLQSDFNQCFEQMRYYDSQIFNILKFMFTGYSALIGISLGFYKFGLEKEIDLSIPIISALSIGLILGFFMFALTVRNRIYFVLVSRYINEQRGFFLQFKPLGFNNQTKMYTNRFQPLFF